MLNLICTDRYAQVVIKLHLISFFNFLLIAWCNLLKNNRVKYCVY